MEILTGIVDKLEEVSEEIIGDASIDEVKETLLSYVDELKSFDNNSEVAVYQQGNDSYKVWITGGMSGGDAPTDAFEIIAALGSLDCLWDQMELFAIDDLQEEAYLNSPD